MSHWESEERNVEFILGEDGGRIIEIYEERRAIKGKLTGRIQWYVNIDDAGFYAEGLKDDWKEARSMCEKLLELAGVKL